MPSLFLDKTKCLTNIEKMAGKTRQHQLSFRPHCKTHQSAEIANWFRDVGVCKITVSSLRMARYFADHGWKDILVAFPFSPLEIEVLNQLAEKCKISILLDNCETLLFLKQVRHQVEFYIDIDTGYGRTGVKSDDLQKVGEIIQGSLGNRHLKFAGFYCHAGHSYKTTTQQERLKIHQKAIKDLQTLKKQFSQHAPKAVYGDTPNCSTQNDFEGIDEITPGNFVFFDLMQRHIGSCITEEIAVAMSCPIAGKYPEGKRLLVHGGAIHFSKEFLKIDDKAVFGEIAEPTNNGWCASSVPVHLNSISQEHGILENCGEFYDRAKIGDTILILPPHSCLTANLMKEFRTMEGKIITTLNS